MNFKKHALAYIFMLPAFSMILLFFFLPVVLTFIFSFTNMGSSTGVTKAGFYVLSNNAIKTLVDDGMDKLTINKINKIIFVVSTKKLAKLNKTFPDLSKKKILSLNKLAGKVYHLRINLERALKKTIRIPTRLRKKIAIYFNASMIDKKYQKKALFISDLKKIGLTDEKIIAKIASSSYSGWIWTLDNYKSLVNNAEIGKIIKNTFIYVFFTLGFFNVSFALVLAISTFYLPRGQGLFFRSIWLIPRISPAVIYILLWKWFTFDTGFLPMLLGIDKNIMLDLAPFTTIIFINGFIGASMGMIIFSSALQAIPKSILYASTIDGASRLQQTRYILLPQLKWPILFITTYGSVAN